MPPKKIKKVEAQDSLVPIIVIDEEEDKKNRAERKFQAFLHNTDEKELIVENLKLFIQELVRYKNMSSLRILDLGCGTGEVPFQLTNALLKDRPSISIVYRGLDINAESVSATKTLLDPLGIDAQVMAGDCFKRENVERLIQNGVDIVLISHVVYWGDIGDVVQLISTTYPDAVLMFIHQHPSSFPSILRKKYSANLNSQVVNDISAVACGQNYSVTRVLMPASIDLSHRPLSEVMIRQASDLSSDAAEERDVALFMVQRSTSSFPATPLLKAGASDIGEDKENVESPKMVSAKTPKTPLWRSVAHDIEEQKRDGNIIFWDVFHICTHDPLLLGFLNIVAKKAMGVLYKEKDFQALATAEGNDGILQELDNIRREQELWYTEDDIHRLLRHYLNEDRYVVMAQTQFEHQGNLADNIVHAVRHVVTGRTAVLPINLHNNHWVGVVIRRLGTGVIQVIYVDPLGNDLTNEPNASVLRDALNNATNAFPGHNVEMLFLRVQQQANSYDCGPFTVDNLVRLALATDLNTTRELEGILYRPETGNAINLREAHGALYDLTPEEYETGNAIELREEHEALYDLTPEEYEVDFVGQANVLAEPGDTGIGELFALSWSGLFLSADS